MDSAKRMVSPEQASKILAEWVKQESIEINLSFSFGDAYGVQFFGRLSGPEHGFFFVRDEQGREHQFLPAAFSRLEYRNQPEGDALRLCGSSAMGLELIVARGAYTRRLRVVS